MQTFENAIYQFVACKEPCSFAFNSDNQRTLRISFGGLRKSANRRLTYCEKPGRVASFHVFISKC